MPRNYFTTPFRLLVPKFDSATGTANYTNAAELRVVDGRLVLNSTGSPVQVTTDNASGNTVNVGAKNGSTVTVAEYGDGVFHKSVFTFTATPITIADATAGGGVKIYDFPEGGITVLGGSFSIAGTVTSILANTLHAASTIEVGLGTASAGAGALTTTEEDIVDGATGPSSATINVAAAAIVGVRTSAPGCLDGHSAAKAININIGVPTDTDIDADASMTLTGTATVIWVFNGDV